MLIDLGNDFDTEGCDGIGTVYTSTMNRIYDVLGWEHR